MKKDTKTKDIKPTKILNVARFDQGILPNEIEETTEGYLKGRCIVTRCGVFLYKNADGGIRRELRPPEEVSDHDSLVTVKMIPIVDGHPTEKLVNADNVKRLAIGYTGESVEDEYPYVIANLVITDQAAVKKIKNKEKNQLSLGYTVDLIPEDGLYNGEPYDYVQKNIRYNHLALVDEARAGPEARIALDGEDAVQITNLETNQMAGKKMKKVRFDTSEYMVDEGVADHIEKLMRDKGDLEKQKEALESKIEEMHNEIDRRTAERDSMRDKDHHNPFEEHEGRKEDIEYEKKEAEMDSERDMREPKDMHPKHMMEKDEIGAKGKEIKDPYDSYGEQSHVRDYEPPSHMRNHVVSEPKNRHYPHDLPHIPKVDQAEFNYAVKTRVNLEKKAARYLDKQTLSRLDGLSDLDIKKRLILNFQPSAQLEGKSEAYLNARFDAIMEQLPREKVMADPARFDHNIEKDRADSKAARAQMIDRMKNLYKTPVRQ